MSKRTKATSSTITMLMLLGLLPAVLLAPPAQARWRPPKLAGLTRVHGTGTGWMPVRLPRDVEPFPAPDQGPPPPPITFSGNGRVIGFVMTRVIDGKASADGPALFGWRLGHCTERGCEYRGPGVAYAYSWRPEDRDGGRQVLPKGRYRLYLIADGAPTRIRIPFPGLDGETTVRPRRAATADLTALEPLSNEDENGTMYWAGKNAELTGEGFALAMLWMDGEDVDGQAGSCIYEDRSPPPGDTAYMPPCPTANVTDANFVDADSNEVGYFGPGTLPLGMGLWRSAEKVDRAGAITLWLRY